MGQERRLRLEAVLGSKRPDDDDGDRQPARLGAGIEPAVVRLSPAEAKPATSAGSTPDDARRRSPPQEGQAPGREPPAADDGRWVENWRANELRWLHLRVADLERQLRRRAIVYAGAFAFGGFVAGAAIGGAVVTVVTDGSPAQPGWVGPITQGEPVTEPAGLEADRAEPTSAEAPRQDPVVRALQEANEEIEALFGRQADDPES